VVDRLLGEAVSARLVVPLDGGACAFVHDLVRETLYAGLEDAESRRRHAAVVRALERIPALAEHAAPASPAHHAYHAVPEIAAADAVALLEAAGRHAAGRLAFAEAVGHHRRALELVPGDRPRDRAAVALRIGAAEQLAGEPEKCFQTYADVAGVARKLDDPELLCRAALRLRGAIWLADSGGVVAARDRARQRSPRPAD
jgi:ATP/maltotriose-dependent transcriptional regulator MalT